MVGSKPSIPPIEWAPDASDAAVADAAWDGYQRRNAGAIADTFAGQFKSTLECNECQHVSVTFDPFTCFSVPIPTMNEIKLQVIYWDSLGSVPIKCNLSFLRSR